MIDFQFKATDTYLIELGNLYARFIRNDAQVLETTQTITGIADGSPEAVVTIVGHGYTDGDHVYISGVGGATELNGRWFIISSKTNDTFELTDPYDGSTVIAFADLTTFTSAGEVGKVYQITTPYAQADLAQLKWTQSADVLTLTHPTYTVRELTRTDHNAWTMSEPTFAPSIADPTVVTQAVNGADNNINWKYKVTAIRKETFEESLAGIAADLPNTVSAITAANPPVATSVAHDLLTGDEVEIIAGGLTEMTELNGRRFTVTTLTADTFSLDGFSATGEDATGYDAETTGGADIVYPTFDVSGTQAAPTGTTIPDNTITWAAVTDAVKYSIYRAEGGRGDYGFLAETAELTYTDDTTAKLETDLAITPPTARNPFRLSGSYPGAVGYYQQRRVFGGSTSKPDTSEYSQTGNQKNFTKSRPIKASDAISVTLNSRKVNQIRHFVPGTDLLVLTDGGEWRVNSGDNSGFSASTLKQEPQTAWGANHLPPIEIGPTALYMQENNIAVRSLGYQLSLDGYTGTDLTLLAPHIFESTTGVSWSFARSPDPVTHVVRSDGSAAVMTFNQEQEVLAWARWDTLGKFKWTAAMRPSSTDVTDAAYFVVERIINGNTVLLIERVASRRFTDVQDAFFVDSGLTLDTSWAITGATLADPVVITVTGSNLTAGDEIDIEGIEWTPQFDSSDNETNPDQLNGRRYFVADETANTVALVSNENPIYITGITEATPGVVTVSDLGGLADGDMIAMHGIAGMTEANDNTYKVANINTGNKTFELNTAADVEVATGGFTTYTAGGSVYHAIDGTAFKAYVSDGKARVAVATVSGLDHLEGEEVVILANGNVITGSSVSGGSITLAEKASRVHVGKKYISDIETLDVEAPDGGTIQGRKKKISNVTVRFEKSRGLLIGPSTSQLVEMQQREFEVMGAPTELLTGDKKINLKPNWNSNGRLFLRQNNPLPMTILALVPDITVGD
tara:strand:+ start:5011 stop:7914 length:2904 start_codon:yes stop_codon:yes gene_type:complete